MSLSDMDTCKVSEPETKSYKMMAIWIKVPLHASANVHRLKSAVASLNTDINTVEEIITSFPGTNFHLKNVSADVTNTYKDNMWSWDFMQNKVCTIISAPWSGVGWTHCLSNSLKTVVKYYGIFMASLRRITLARYDSLVEWCHQ